MTNKELLGNFIRGNNVHNKNMLVESFGDRSVLSSYGKPIAGCKRIAGNVVIFVDTDSPYSVTQHRHVNMVRDMYKWWSCQVFECSGVKWDVLDDEITVKI